MAGRDEAARRRAHRLVAKGGLTRVEIARRCGVQPRTLGRWIAAGNWRIGAPAPRPTPRPNPRPTPRGAAPKPASPALSPAKRKAGLDGATLRRRLRRHVARQIAVLDAELGEGFGQGLDRGSADGAASSPRAPDSARMLRDAAGLKRVIDALDREGGAGNGAEGSGGSGGESGHDLGALREAIARRYEAFAGDGPAAGLPGEPA